MTPERASVRVFTLGALGADCPAVLLADPGAGIAGQLAAAGVRHVQVDGRCAAERPDLCSYRRDGRTGRFADLVWLTS